MDIVLVRPPAIMSYYTLGPDTGFGFLSKVCKEAGFKVKIIDLQLESFRKRRDYVAFLVELVKQLRPSAIGLKLYTMDMDYALKSSVALKKALPETTLIVGGPHPSSVGKEIFDHLRYFDFAFQGEAEKGLPVLLQRLKEKSTNFGDIPGLMYRDNLGVVQANEKTLTENLDELGIPDYEEMPPFAYPLNYTGDIFVPIMTTRGCPFHCRYCAGNLITSRRLRHRSPELVIDELKFLKGEYGVKSFAILDDNFVLDLDYAKSVLHMLIQSGLNLSWTCSGGLRLDSIDEEVIQLMEKSGCTLVYVAVESGSQRTLNAMNRHCTVETMVEKVNMIKKCSNIKMTAFFIIGYPGENGEDIEKTIKLAKELPIHKTSFFFFVPLPGTPVWKELVDKGVLPAIPSDWEDYMVHKHIIPLDGVSPLKLEYLKLKGYLGFYLRPRIVGDMIGEIKSPYQLYRIFQRTFQVLFNR